MDGGLLKAPVAEMSLQAKEAMTVGRPEGDAGSSFDSLYGASYATVYRAVLLGFGSVPLAEDATQEAFSRLLERWTRLRSHPNPVGWTLLTALNVARRSRRRERRGREREVEALDGDRVPAQDPAEIEAFPHLLEGLPRRQREVLVLHYWSDLGVREIGQLLGISSSAVKTHLARGRDTLRRSIEGDDYD